jgi:ADP-ribosylglycohydrolase
VSQNPRPGTPRQLRAARALAGTKTTSFPFFQPHSRFTDDTALTVATAHAILTGTPCLDVYRYFGRLYSDAGYGGMFIEWLMGREPRPYNSWATARPCGWCP